MSVTERQRAGRYTTFSSNDIYFKMPLPFNKSLDLKLLALVKEYPQLYNPAHEKYMDVNTREVIWQKIGDTLCRPAMEFAAIQCQIHFGDFNEEKHKPGILENLNEYLPENFASSWGAEKKILKLFRKYQGLSQLEAKHVYTKTARDLPTFGVTFFLVKEKQKGKKKMVPRLLGINAESILRLDEQTKEILQVWPLTHVKTYQAGKNDSFTLNFGDYSEKEYSVKTNDALRIRDILEGYIDIIGKRLCARGAAHLADGGAGAVSHHTVQASTGNMMAHVVNTPSKVVEESLVGPSKLLPFEQGLRATHGTQVMTVQQIITTNKASTKQEIISGEVPMRSDMSQELVKKLNGMNSNAVKIVTLLGEPNAGNVDQARRIIAKMAEDFPTVQSGVKDAAAKQTSEEAKNKLLKELDELAQLIALSSRTVQDDNNQDYEEVLENAKRVADLTTRMYFSLDPKTRKRSILVRRSRQSFIEDERVEGQLRRASFLAAAAGAEHALSAARGHLLTNYEGPNLNEQEINNLEVSAVDKLGNLNAAIALFLTSHSDSKNIDYPAAINSMNTIKELLPLLTEDAKAIAHSKGGEAGQEIINETKALCDAASRVCQLTGCDDHSKIQAAANEYADTSGRLVYVFGSRHPLVNADKENEIMDLARQVGDKATSLLVKASELTSEAASEPGAQHVDAAGVAAADVTRDLLLCAQLAAPTIHEAHCQSALTAAAENLSSAAQKLALTWKPLVDKPERHQAGEHLAALTMDLAKALDALKASYANLENMEVDEKEELSPEQAQKLRFITGVSSARAAVQAAKDKLHEPLAHSKLSDNKASELHDSISQRLAQSNVSVAKLLQARSGQPADYATADAALAALTDLTPQLVEDTRSVIASSEDERCRQMMLADLGAWCHGVHSVCANSASDNAQDLENAVKEYGQASKKLSFVFSPRARRAREQLLMELFGSAHKKALQMVDDSNKMADSMGGASGGRLRHLGSDVRDSAAALHNTLMVTAPTLGEERCRSALEEQSSALRAAAARLAEETDALADDETGCRVLAATLQQQRAHVLRHAAELAAALAAARTALHHAHHQEIVEETPTEKVQRLKFITSASAVQAKAQEVEHMLQKPTVRFVLSEQQAKELEEKRARELAAVNAAVAILLHAKSDHGNPDYEAAEQAMETVSELMPGIIKDTCALSGACADEAARRALLDDTRAWTRALRAIGTGAAQPDFAEFVDSAQQLADTSTKLNFIFNPRRLSAQGQQVMQHSRRACELAGQMASDAEGVSAALPPQPAASLRLRATRLAAAARALRTTAQLTAPCLEEPRSKQALIASSSGVGSFATELVSHTAEHPEPRCQDLSKQLASQKEELDKALHSIKDTCQIGDAPEDPVKKEHRLKCIAKLSAAEKNMQNVDKMFDQAGVPGALSEQQAVEARARLAPRLARLHAALARLLLARLHDSQNPDFVTAENSIDVITNLLPSVVKDTQALASSCKSVGEQQAMVGDVRAWCDSVRAVCAGATAQEGSKELEAAMEKLAASSDKLNFIVGNRKGHAEELEVCSVARQASEVAQRMCAEAERVQSAVRPRDRGPGAASLPPAALRAAALRLRAAAHLTGPSINEHESKAVLLSSVDDVKTAACDLLVDAQRSPEPALRLLAAELQADQEKLHAALSTLEDICAHRKIPMEMQKQLQKKFKDSVLAVENEAKQAENILDQPIPKKKLEEKGIHAVQSKLSVAMSRVNAAVAAVVNAKSDTQQLDYEAAHKSIETISELIPKIVNDTKTLIASKEEEVQQGSVEEIRDWCRAVRSFCSIAAEGDAKALNESALNLNNCAQKLCSVFTPRQSPVTETQVLQLSNSAHDKAQQMVEETRRVARSPDAARDARVLEAGADRLGAAAHCFLTVAQVTAACMDEPLCQAQLVSSGEGLSRAGAALVRATARATTPATRRLSEEASRYQLLMDQALASLTAAITAGNTRGRGRAPPPVPTRMSTTCRGPQSDAVPTSPRGPVLPQRPLSPRGPVSPRVRVVSHSDVRRASQDLLNDLRRESSNDLELTSAPLGLSKSDIAELNKKAEEERLRKQNFIKMVDTAGQRILAAEKDLDKMHKPSAGVPPLDVEQVDAVHKQMEDKVASASTAAAKFIASNHPDVMDYPTATQAADSLSELVSDIVKDAALLSNSQDEKTKRPFLDQIKAVCEATKRLVTTAEHDAKNLNEAAVEFGDKTAALMYSISTDIDPAQEKGVIERARGIGDNVLQLVSRGAALGDSPPAVHHADRAARAALALVYTAKLVAPLVHHQQCQNSLITASHELSSRLKEYSASVRPLSCEPQHGKLATEMLADAAELEKSLDSFRQDLAAGKMVKRRQVEKIVIEHTPLRELATLVMNVAQERGQSAATADRSKQAYSAYAASLAAAIRAVDVAHARSRRRPTDLNKYRILEVAIQNLQITLLQSRPAQGDRAQNNIVDLNDFVKETSKEAEKLIAFVDKINPGLHKKDLQNIKMECNKINEDAMKLINATDRQDGDADSLDGMLEVDQFAQNCDSIIENIKSLIEGIPDKDMKSRLKGQSLPLVESCYLLRFASRSAVAVGESAALAETLDELHELGARLPRMLLPAAGASTPAAPCAEASNDSALLRARDRLAGAAVAAAGGGGVRLPGALLAYATQLRARCQLADPAHRDKVKEHMSRVVDTLRELTAATSARVVAWLPLQSPELTAITDTLLQELDNMPSINKSDDEKSHVKDINQNYLNSLLMPSDVKIEGDPKQVEATIQQSATRLVSLASGLQEEGGAPAAVPAAVREALRLAAAAKSLPQKSPVQAKRLEEACQEMCWATYKLLKSCEEARAGAGAHLAHPARDTLQVEALTLVDAVNKLTRQACSDAGLRGACGVARRALLVRRSGPACAGAASYDHTLQLLNSQEEVLQKLSSDEPVPREEFTKSLSYIGTAACNSIEYAAQCAYLISISEQHKDMAKKGLVDVKRLQKLSSAVQESCFLIMRTNEVDLAKKEASKVCETTCELQQGVKGALAAVHDGGVKRELTECGFKLDLAAKALNDAVNHTDPCMDKINTSALALVDSISALNNVLEKPSLSPVVGEVGAETKALVDDVTAHSKTLTDKTQALIRQVEDAGDDEDPMTWVTYNTARKEVLDAFDGLVKSIRQSGERAGLVEVASEVEEENVPVKSFVQIQEETARGWLSRGAVRARVGGQAAADQLLAVAAQMAEDMKGQEKEDMESLIKESRTLLVDCSKKYDNDKASTLMELLRDIRRAVEKVAVSRVVEDLLYAEEPLQDLDILLDAEPDEGKRKFLLEKKIAELMCALGRTTRVARALARAAAPPPQLEECTLQTELLAPQLVAAAQARLSSPQDAGALQEYRALLAQYAASLCKVRELCDSAVDPLHFVQTAGETMARMREESSRQRDPRLHAHTAAALARLVRRVLSVSMSSEVARADPELRAALAQAADKLPSAAPASTAAPVRASRLPDWQDTTEQILRTTGEVESALGGENIFKKLPEPDQPIYNAALSLHSAVRGWSARDNEIVAVAKRMAVLMARLSDQMNEDRKRELIATSKNIVIESREVAAQAKKLAHECPDVRIRTNLLQVCERIPTISGQLKMLTTVKSSALGLQGGEEDREAMNMLVTNAQNLMSSVQEVVKAAASASVKIASQRGLKWVRKNY